MKSIGMDEAFCILLGMERTDSEYDYDVIIEIDKPVRTKRVKKKEVKV